MTAPAALTHAVLGQGLLAQNVLAQASEDAAQACQALQDGASQALCELIAKVVPSALVATWLADFLPRIIKVLLILVAAWLLNRLARRLIRKFVDELNERGMERLEELRQNGLLADSTPLSLRRATMRTTTIGGVLRSLSTVVVWTVALLMALGELGANLGPLIAGAGIVGVALGFGSQKLVQDFLSGVFMLLEDQYGVGDIVDLGEASGVVEGVSLRTTRIRDVNGIMWHIPNGQVARVGNMSQLWSRALLDIGVAYDTDLDHASHVIEAVATELSEDEHWREQFIEGPEVWGVQELADSAITIRVVMKVVPAQQWAIERELRARIKRAFDAEGIEIPFPQRVVWMREDDGSDGEGGDGDGEGGGRRQVPAGGASGPRRRRVPAGDGAPDGEG